MSCMYIDPKVNKDWIENKEYIVFYSDLKHMFGGLKNIDEYSWCFEEANYNEWPNEAKVIMAAQISQWYDGGINSFINKYPNFYGLEKVKPLKETLFIEEYPLYWYDKFNYYNLGA